jgi:hypothetical protein
MFSMVSHALHFEETYSVFDLAKEKFQFQPHATDIVSVPANSGWVFSTFIPIGKAPILSYIKEDSFKAACEQTPHRERSRHASRH